MPEPRPSHRECLSAFPHLTYEEFEYCIDRLMQRNHQHGHKHNDWLSIDVVTTNGTTFLSIAKPLLSGAAITLTQDETDDEVEEEEDDEDDDEALRRPVQNQPISHYDVALSPTYRVPVLYISISDTQQRYPPTMATLKEHIIPPQYQAETERVGVLGGITITEHPATNRPVFFIHPCQTAEVMEAIAGGRHLTADEYLLLWLGAFGKCVGLDVPLALARELGSSEQSLD